MKEAQTAAILYDIYNHNRLLLMALIVAFSLCCVGVFIESMQEKDND